MTSLLFDKYTIKEQEFMFFCDKCGLCCMHIDESRLDEGMNRGDGVCIYFDEDSHLCKIYSDRPIICNVDKFYDRFLSSNCLKEEFYFANYEACKKLKERYGR